MNLNAYAKVQIWWWIKINAFQMFKTCVLKEMVGSILKNIMFVSLLKTVLLTSNIVMDVLLTLTWILMNLNGIVNYSVIIVIKDLEKFKVDVMLKVKLLPAQWLMNQLKAAVNVYICNLLLLVLLLLLLLMLNLHVLNALKAITWKMTKEDATLMITNHQLMSKNYS